MKKKTVIIIGLLLVLLAGFLPACRGTSGAFGFGGSSSSIIAGKRPTKSSGIRREERLTDNVVAPRGDFWKSELTTIFSSADSFAEYDLGKPTHIVAAYLQGDNNDSYILSASDDGVNFQTLWEAPALTAAGGLQPRQTDTLNATARYVRVSARGGDGSYALSELQIFDEIPSVFPPQPTVRESIPPDEILRTKILQLGLALAIAVALTWRGAPIWWTLLMSALPLAAGFDAWRALVLAWPPGTREVSLVRGVVAAVGCLVVIREVFAPAKFLADRRVSVGALGVCAALSIGAFYNLGQPQFHDYQHDRPGFVHNFDMRVYFPIAKYFKELRFDGLYLGSVAAYVDDDKSVTLESLSYQQLRSLRTHQMVKVGDSIGDIKEVRSRFSPARWEEFKKDMRYFRENMGVRDYLGSMSDHGGNATPVWFLFGHMLFAKAQAGNGILTATAMLDPLLLLIAVIAIWRAFGLRTALIATIIFGANDFYMFGTCWAGATLRHDWLAYLAIGISALKLEKWKTAGAFLMLSGLIRAFPFFALVGCALPALWWAVDYYRTNKKLPRLELIKVEQKPLLLVIASATVTGLTLFLASSFMFGFHSWVEWFHKVSMLQRDPHVNHVSLRALIGGPDGIHTRVLAARTNIYVAGIAAYAIMVFLTCRQKSLAFAACIGTVMIPVAFHPANYYIHFVFVLPMLAAELPKKGVGASLWPTRPLDSLHWVTLLMLCAIEYAIAIEKDLGLHFYFSAAALMVAITTILLVQLIKDYRLAEQLVPAGADLLGGPVIPPAPAAQSEPPPPPPEEEPIAARAEDPAKKPAAALDADANANGEPAPESPPGAAEEKPAEEKPAEEKPTEEKPTEPHPETSAE